MKLDHIRAGLQAGLVAAAAISLLFAAAPAVAQEDDDIPQLTKPIKDQDSAPGLQQTPDGQTMKTAGEAVKPARECSTGGSTGPTFPKIQGK